MITDFQKSLVSIIVPVYKTEQYLSKCIDSILAQTYQNLELILVDDGSPDASPAICDRYAEKDPRVRVIHKPNAGVSAARNDGIAAAKGDLITFSDSDDWMEPDMIGLLAEGLAKNDNAMVSVCGWYRHEDDRVFDYGSNLPRGLVTGKEAFQWAVRGTGFEGYVWNKMYRRSLFDQGLCFPSDITICEDLLVNCTVFLNCDFVYVVNKPLYHYLIRPGSALSNSKEKIRTEYISRNRILDMVRDDPVLYGVAQYAYVQAKLSLAFRLHREGEKKLASEALTDARERLAPALKSKVGIKGKVKILMLSVSPYRSLELWLYLKKALKLQPFSKHGEM